jgi:hypothetical protein
LRAAHLQDEQKSKEIIEKLLAITKEYETKMKEDQENQSPQPNRCPIS